LKKNICGIKHMEDLIVNRMTILHFIIGSFSVLSAFDKCPYSKQDVIEWVYSQQIPETHSDSNSETCFGFRGGPYSGFSSNQDYLQSGKVNKFDMPSLPNTYTALCLLKMCGDDLSRVNKKGISKSLKRFQLENGSFRCLPDESETDVRFLYCACAISEIINDWDGINLGKATEYALTLQSYDYTFGWDEGSESHGGLNFCVLASLKLMKSIDKVLHKEDLVEWLLKRQTPLGMEGRVQKVPDSCYIFWNISSLHILGYEHLIDKEALKEAVLRYQSNKGGFSKFISVNPDVLHTYYGLSSLSILGHGGMQKFNVILGISSI